MAAAGAIDTLLTIDVTRRGPRRLRLGLGDRPRPGRAITIAAYATPLVEGAMVVLPAATTYETEGVLAP